jgi:recombination associated protein RdgC
MLFSSLYLLRLAKSWNMPLESLEALLAKNAYIPCGQLDRERGGWLPPVEHGNLVHSVGGQWLLRLCVDKKILPAAVVKKAVRIKIAEIQKREGRKPGKKEMKEIKDGVVLDLLPKAFSQETFSYIWVDPTHGWMGIDAGSVSKMEKVVDYLSKSIPNLPVSLIDTHQSPSAVMAECLISGEGHNGFTIDQDCELKSNDEAGSSVRYKHHDLGLDEIRDHLTNLHKEATSLALTFDSHISFVLSHRMEFKKIEFAGVKEEGSEQNAEEVFDAEFTLMAGEFRKLAESFVEFLGGEKPAEV